MCGLFLKRVLAPIASMVSGGLYDIGENCKDFLINSFNWPLLPQSIGAVLPEDVVGHELRSRGTSGLELLSRATSGLTRDR
jgi:hypothetical protein